MSAKKDKHPFAFGSIRKRLTKGDKPAGSPTGTSSAMPETQSRQLNCLIAGESIIFVARLGCDYVVSDLKGVIQKERALDTLKDVGPHILELWKPNDFNPITAGPADTLAARIRSLGDSLSQYATKLEPADSLFKIFPNQPPSEHLHVIVKVPATVAESTLKKLKLKEDCIYASYVQREITVAALYEKLVKQRWVHVRGTPGSGKSVLAGLLRRYINQTEPDTEVVFLASWPENLPVQITPNTILILDEAQTTYWDKNFWNKFKNPSFQGMRLVALASHGSSGYTGADNISPMWIGKEHRVGLARLDCGDGILVGLLFTKEEFNALVQLKFHNNHFSDSFLDCVFDMTNGHVGACKDLMDCVAAHKSYRERVKSAEYTYEMFVAGVSMADIAQAIYSRTVFGRGLPQANVLRQNPDVTAVMSEVLRKESIVCPDDYLASDPSDDDNRKAALRMIFQFGWLHTEDRADINGILYTFASPLHRRCIDWKLNGSPLESRIIEPNLFEFSLAFIQRFSRQSLEKREIGPKAQSIPEAQFQDEFYSTSSKHASGSVSFPEFGTKNGRIDFFIRSKKWGVELLRDGNRLSQHARRFTEGEYGKWVENGWMSDYIIIDFRTRPPKIVHRDIDKLIYVVSVDDWNTIEVLDNGGKVLHQYSLLNNS